MMMPKTLSSRKKVLITQSLSTSSSGVADVIEAGMATLWEVSPMNRETMMTVTVATAIRHKAPRKPLKPERCWTTPSMIRLWAIRVKTAISVIWAAVKGMTVIMAATG